MVEFKLQQDYVSPIKIGKLWAKIKHLKSYLKALGFGLEADMKWGTKN